MKMFECLCLILCLAAGAAEPAETETAGVGVELGLEAQHIVVKRIFPDSPAAAQKSLSVGDRITAVAQDNEPAVQIEGIQQALISIRGPKGTTVRLTVVPSGEDWCWTENDYDSKRNP